MDCRRPLILLLALTLVACTSGGGGATAVPLSGGGLQLIGQIQPERDTVAVGEDLFVDYELHWPGAQRLIFEVRDPSLDPDAPFHGYSFNGALSRDSKVPLELLFLGPQPLGRQTIAPGGSLTFARIRWRASQPGIYKLTFQVEWHEGQIIDFEPVEVEVTGVGGEAAPADPEAAKQAQALVLELEKNATPEKRARRGEIRVALTELGAGVAPQLVAGLDSPTAETRTTLVRVLTEIGPRVAPAVIAGLGRGTVDRRTRCVYVLAQLRSKVEKTKAYDAKVVAALTAAAGTDPSPQVREVACDALAGYFDKKDAVPPLLDGLADKELRVRRACQRWLKRLTGAKAVAFDPKAAPAERSKAIAAWRTLWKSRGIGK